jgi:hypothetical protein
MKDMKAFAPAGTVLQLVPGAFLFYMKDTERTQIKHFSFIIRGYINFNNF